MMGPMALYRNLMARARGEAARERAFFDTGYYLDANPDVAAAGIDPFAHYMANGWREGRNPSAAFHTLFYRDAYLAGAPVNPLSHFAGPGRANRPAPLSAEQFTEIQKTLTRDLFDAEFYVAQWGAFPLADPLAHYLTAGWKQGKLPAPAFDAHRHMLEHPFLTALDVSPLYHFASQQRFRASGAAQAGSRTNGTSRGPGSIALGPAPRDLKAKIAPAFDRRYYLSQNPDVQKSKIDPLTHYIEHGWREGRNPSPLFDTRYYLAANPDVEAAGLNPYYHYLTAGRAAGLRASPVGTRLYPAMGAPADADWDDVPAKANIAAAAVIVIIPVYKGYGETLRAIHAVLAARQQAPFALHVINDVSPDPQLTETLEGLAARGLFSYSRNQTNLGFVKTVNRGLRQFAAKDVILLNSDAKVSGDWLDRMAAHAARDPSIATITPLSNNATICSYPLRNGNNVIEPGASAEMLDQFAAECNKGRLSDIPTGVGFCFYMSSASREAVGILDEETFGRGYGEENDFCLRAAQAGFRNVLAEDIFVYHVGEVSLAEFVSEEYGRAQRALIAKHPGYPQLIKQHLIADESLYGRIRLDLFRLAKAYASKAVIFVTHALSGGVLTHTAHMEKRLREDGIAVISIRVGTGGSWNIEIKSHALDAPYAPNLVPLPFHQYAPLLADFLTWLQPLGIHVHSLAGFNWTATVSLLGLIRRSGIKAYFTLHDYSVVCHRNDLVRPNETYCGLPDVSVCQICVATDRTYPEGVSPAERRRVYADFLGQAAGVFAPSQDIIDRLKADGATYGIILRPHEEDVSPIAVPGPLPGTEFIDIVTIGAIGAHKGARIILNLARDAATRKLPLRYHIIGYSDATSEMLEAGVNETGRYNVEAEAIDHLRAIRPALVFLPSIWPETYCYALSLAFRGGIPPVVFDIGAQASRVAATGFGHVLAYDLTQDIRGLSDRLCALPAVKPICLDRPSIVAYPNILKDYYAM